MSYALPTAHQPWNGAGGRARFHENGYANGNTNGGVAEKIGGMFGDRRPSLPMYKDKPFAYPGSGRRGPWFKSKRVIAGIALAITALYYLLGSSSSTDTTQKASSSKSSSGGWFGSSSSAEKINWDDRREKVRDAFKLSWKAYEDHGWGLDVFRPVSKSGRQMVPNGMGWIIVDALDTLMLMNLTTELDHARRWVSTTLTYDQDHDVNTFETTIRMLGGLLSAHYLSTTFPDMAALPTGGNAPSEDLYLEKATDLADRLLGAYESNSGVPYASVNLHTMQGIPSHDDGGASSTAEATSLQLEMKYLAKLTGEVTYWEKAEKVMQVVDDNGQRDGLLPIFIYADRGNFRGSNIRLGSRGDSYYEYLIKQYLQTSKQEPIYLDLWDESLAGVQKHLITYSKHTNLTILAERPNGLDGNLMPKMDHLVCFMPGTIALGATNGLPLAEAKALPSWGAKQDREMDLARELMKTCWGMYKTTSTGLAPEIAHFEIHDPPLMMPSPDSETPIPSSPETLVVEGTEEETKWKSDYVIKGADSHNLQRPETVESLFYMWRITGDEIYRHWGWEMFSSFIEHTAVEGEGGYSSISDVNKIPSPTRDNMESFWLAETLKYFYLLFGPTDVLPLDKVVFNTEAHAFPHFELGKLFKTGWERKKRDKEGKIVKDEVKKVPVPVAAAGEMKKEVEGKMVTQTVVLKAEETDKKTTTAGEKVGEKVGDVVDKVLEVGGNVVDKGLL